MKSSGTGFERYLALYQTPQEIGGCQGCRFFLMCKGQCPGTAIDGDWRNRTEHCAVWKELFTHFEAELQLGGDEPISCSVRREEIEQAFIQRWSKGKTVIMEEVLAGPQFRCQAKEQA